MKGLSELSGDTFARTRRMTERDPSSVGLLARHLLPQGEKETHLPSVEFRSVAYPAFS